MYVLLELAEYSSSSCHTGKHKMCIELHDIFSLPCEKKNTLSYALIRNPTVLWPFHTKSGNVVNVSWVNTLGLFAFYHLTVILPPFSVLTHKHNVSTLLFTKPADTIKCKLVIILMCTCSVIWCQWVII